MTLDNQPKTRLIFTGAGSCGKSTLKSEFVEELAEYGWESRDSTASSRKIKWGINMKDPSQEEKYFFQSLAFPLQLISDIEEVNTHSVSERFALDFLAFTATLTPDILESQKAVMILALKKGLYQKDMIYYLPPLPTFTHAENRFIDTTIYTETDKNMLDLLEELHIPHIRLNANTTIVERKNRILEDLKNKGLLAQNLLAL